MPFGHQCRNNRCHGSLYQRRNEWPAGAGQGLDDGSGDSSAVCIGAAKSDLPKPGECKVDLKNPNAPYQPSTQDISFQLVCPPITD